jgi:hypothetical protein
LVDRRRRRAPGRRRPCLGSRDRLVVAPEAELPNPAAGHRGRTGHDERDSGPSGGRRGCDAVHRGTCRRARGRPCASPGRSRRTRSRATRGSAGAANEAAGRALPARAIGRAGEPLLLDVCNWVTAG